MLKVNDCNMDNQCEGDFFIPSTESSRIMIAGIDIIL